MPFRGKAIYGQVRKQVANVFDVENELLSRVLFFTSVPIYSPKALIYIPMSALYELPRRFLKTMTMIFH